MNMSPGSHGVLRFMHWFDMSMLGYDEHDYDYCWDMSIDVPIWLSYSYYLLRAIFSL